MDNLLNLFDRPFVLSHTSVRAGEQKLGETMHLLDEEGDFESALKATGAKFAVLFIPEDVGIRANCGRPGASSTWEPALKGLCNIQDNFFLRGNDILLLGSIATEDLMTEAKELREDTPQGLNALRELTQQLDDRVRSVVAEIYKAGLFPIVIGGGHNNAYPIITAWYDTHEDLLSVINLDPHADYRAMEGRHSGNGFRYAHENGVLDRYAVVGLHESYNSQEMMDILRQDPDLRYSTFEDIAVREILPFHQAIGDSLDFVAEGPFGIELDLDSIPGIPVSAATPTGFTLEQARQYIYKTTQRDESRYLHICEGSAGLASPHQLSELSKVIACLVADAIKGKLKK